VLFFGQQAEQLLAYFIIKKHGMKYLEVLVALGDVLGVSESQLLKGYETARQFYERSRETQNQQQAKENRTFLAPFKEVPPPMFMNSERYGGAFGLRDGSDFPAIVESYRELFCRRCYVYDCRLHGVQQPLPRQREDPVRHCEGRRVGILHAPTAHVFFSSGPCYVTARDPQLRARDGALMQSLWNDLDVLKRAAAASDNSTLVSAALNARKRFADVLSGHAPGIAVCVVVFQRVVRARQLRNVVTYDGVFFCAERRNSEQQAAGDHHGADYTKMVAELPSDHRSGSRNKLASNGADAEWNHVEHLLVEKLRDVTNRDPVRIAQLLGTKTPEQVAAYLLTAFAPDIPQEVNGSKSAENAAGGEQSGSGNVQSSVKTGKVSSRRRTRWTSTRKKTDISRQFFKQGVRLGRKQMNREYYACNHDGPCTAQNCSCVKNGTFCEKFCACSRECTQKFPGCKCKRGVCRTIACPCFVAARECDPDLCVHCGASIHPTVVKEIHSAVPSLLNVSDHQNAQDGDDDVVPNAEDEIKICRNTALRYSTSKKVSIARSGIHGWGAFIMEPAEKNEFIMEYVGEIVSQVRPASLFLQRPCYFLFVSYGSSLIGTGCVRQTSAGRGGSPRQDLRQAEQQLLV
jgi:hypothetical protein